MGLSAFIGFILILRLFIETSLKNFGDLGSHKIGDLSIDILIAVPAFFYFLKKLVSREKIILPRAWIILSVFGLICIASIFYSKDVPVSLLSTIDVWAFILLLAVLVNLLDSLGRIQVIIFFLIATALIASVEAIFEYFFQLPWYMAHANSQMIEGSRNLAQLIQSHRTPTLFLWPNTLAGFLIMILPLIVGFFTYSQIIYRISGMAIGCILLYTLFIELSISSWVSLFLAASILLACFKDRFLNQNIRKWILGSVVLSALLVNIVVIKKISFTHLNSFVSRQEYFTDAFFLIREHPIIGNGWSSFGTASAPYANSINGLTNYAHNTYVQILSELGLLGFLVFMLFLFFLWKDALVLTRNKEHQWLLLALLTGIAACMLDNLFSYTMLLPSVSFYWWMIVGILFSFQAIIKPSQGILITGTRLKIFLIAASLGLACLAVRCSVAEYYYFTALPYIHDNSNQERAVTLFQKAHKLNPWDKKFELGEAVAYYELFNRSADKEFLELAHTTILKTMGQVSLGAERHFFLEKIDTALSLSPRGS